MLKFAFALSTCADVVEDVIQNGLEFFNLIVRHIHCDFFYTVTFYGTTTLLEIGAINVILTG